MTAPYEDPARARCPDPIEGEGDVRASMRGADAARTSECRFRAFGTFVSIAAYGGPGACAEAFAEAVGACRAYERRLSTRLPHSDIARLNASRGKPCAVHPETAGLLEAAKGYCALSGGAFDITVQPAVKLWDFREGRVPRAAELARAVSHVDWRAVETFERCFRRGGKLYHHVLDPRTGMPVETDLASATVVSRRAIDAEGLSTTLLALGRSGPSSLRQRRMLWRRPFWSTAMAA